MSDYILACPICGREREIVRRGEPWQSECPNGHKWYYCSVHDTKILGEWKESWWPTEDQCICDPVKKISDRRKYNPDGTNEYTAPSEKPPRYDLRRKHKTLDDPLNKKDRALEEKDMKVSNQDKVTKLAKEIAREKIRTAGEVKHIKDMSGFNLDRQNIDGFQFKETGMKAVAETYKHLASAFYHMIQATNTFNRCKSSQVSPDGKLGGKGYVQPIKHIRSALSDSVNVLSELIDTFYDEVTSPYWKKTTFEDHPIVKDLLSEADEIIEKAEKVEDVKEEQNTNLDKK